MSDSTPHNTYGTTDVRTFYPTIYVTLANLITQNPFIQELQANGEFVFDFLPYPDIAAEYSQPPVSTTPRDQPRLYLIRTNTKVVGLNSCQKQWTLGYNIIVQGLHLRSEIVDQLAGQLDYLFSEGTPLPTICGRITSAVSQFNYDIVKQTVASTLSISITCATSR